MRVDLTVAEFRRVLGKCGIALIGQTPEIAPADRKLYALRDVTATVESRPLIAASIMSKKMAEGISGLVLDVKTGAGAFLPRFEDSVGLAETMVAIGHGMGKKIAALVTDMDQPLGRAAGNALETAECIETLKSRGPADTEALSVELAAWMLLLAEVTPDLDSARARVRQALSSGAGLRKLEEVIELQGGDPRVCSDAGRLPRARDTVDLRSADTGYIVRIACRDVGHAIMLLGAGRETVDGTIDPAVGVVFHKKVGDGVQKGDALLSVHVNDRRRLDECLSLLRRSVAIGLEPPAPAPLVRQIFEG
jgi:pyrimidine-nucleoside phosphorylase/thymidine phosphorylase